MGQYRRLLLIVHLASGHSPAIKQAAALADLELLLAQRQTQIEDLQQQREILLRERVDARQQSHALQLELQALQLKTEQERVAQESYVRGVEDRAHREIDRTREDGKVMSIQLKEAGRRMEQLQRRLESNQAELNQTLQRAAAQQARADTLEQQLTQLRQTAGNKRKPRSRKPASELSNP